MCFHTFYKLHGKSPVVSVAKKDWFALVPPSNSKLNHTDHDMQGTFFDMKQGNDLLIITVKFAAGLMRDNFEYRHNGKIRFYLNDDEKIEEIVL